MIDLLVGFVILAATWLMLWTFMPRNGMPHASISTWGTYIGVGITSGLGLGAAMVIAGAVRLFG